MLIKIGEVILSIDSVEKNIVHGYNRHYIYEIKSPVTLSDWMGLDVVDDLDGWLDKYLKFRELVKKEGWEEKLIDNPSEWGFQPSDYSLKFEQVFKPICKHWEEWRTNEVN